MSCTFVIEPWSTRFDGHFNEFNCIVCITPVPLGLFSLARNLHWPHFLWEWTLSPNKTLSNKKCFLITVSDLHFLFSSCYAIYQRKGIFPFFHFNSSHHFMYFWYVCSIPLLSKSNNFIFWNSSPWSSFCSLPLSFSDHTNIWCANSRLDTARSLTLLVTHQIINLKHTNIPSGLSGNFCVI